MKNGVHFPFCNACDKFLPNKKHNIQIHMDSESHKKEMDNFLSKQQQQNQMESFLNNPIETRAKRLETRLALMVTQYPATPFDLPGEVLKIFKEECNDPVIHRATMAETKTASIVRQGI